MSKILLLRPRLSEQTYAQAQTGRVYVFDVSADANKHTIARAVTAQFDVAVESVNVTNIKGKAKKTVSLTGRRRRATDGTRQDIKKAYVKLVPGASLPIFAAVEESRQKEEATQEQVEKAVTKQRKTESNKSTRTSTANRVTRIFKKQGDK